MSAGATQYPELPWSDIMARCRCSSDGCKNVGTWMPVLVMRPNGIPGQKDSARAEIALPFCWDHKIKLTVSDLLTDEGWASMSAEFARDGRFMPDRSAIELDFRHMTAGYCH